MATKVKESVKGKGSFSYEEMLAKALGTTPDKVVKVSELTKGADEAFNKSMEKTKGVDAPFVPYKAPIKKNGKTSQEVMAEVEEAILNEENSEETSDAEEIEIVEVTPSKGKKVLAQNSAQAQKILAKVAEPKPEVKMTEEEIKTARRKEISRIALEAKRAKKLALEGKLASEGKEMLEGQRQFVQKEKEVKKVAEAKPTRTKGNNTTPLSKMTVAELKGMKGKISDVQLNKYFKMASKRDGVELIQVAPVSKPVAEKKVPEITRTRTRTTTPQAEVPSLSFDETIKEMIELYVKLGNFLKSLNGLAR